MNRLRTCIVLVMTSLAGSAHAQLPVPGATRNIPTCALTAASPAWSRNLIHDGIFGNDGVALNTTIQAGCLVIASPWEQSGDITVSRSCDAGSTWTTAVIDAAFVSAEGVEWGDFDQDGQDDICAASQTGDVAIYFAPSADADLVTPAAWTKMPVTNADMNSLEGWMTCLAADLNGDTHKDLVVGGTTLTNTGDIAVVYGPAAGKRTDANWPAPTLIRTAGRVMSLHAVDFEPDGDMDLVGATRYAPNVGTWKAVNDGVGNFTFSDISTNVAGTQVLMMFTPGDLDLDGRLDVCNGSDGGTSIRCHANMASGWSKFIPTLVRFPATVGQYQSSSIGDLDLDGYPDIILSFSGATSGQSGLVGVRGPYFRERFEIEGIDATTSKFDNAVVYDVDGDGDKDVIAGNQGNEDGVQESNEGLSWWENPCK